MRPEKEARLCLWIGHRQKKIKKKEKKSIAEKEKASVWQAFLSPGCLCLLFSKAVLLHPEQQVTFVLVFD